VESANAGSLSCGSIQRHSSASTWHCSIWLSTASFTSGRYVLPCRTFSVLASFRASSTANSRMYPVTERPAARAWRDNRSTSRAMLSAFVAGSCRQNSTSPAMTPTPRNGTRPTQIHINRDSSDELGSGANCSDLLDCLEVPTRDKGDFRRSRLLHGVRESVWPFCVAFERTPPVGCR
jgi:hypothetical protein